MREPSDRDDALAAARGIVLALPIGAALWALVLVPALVLLG